MPSDGSGKATEGPVPFELSEVAGTAREQLIEMVAEADDALMERFFEAGTLTAGGTARRAAQGRARGQGGAAALHVGPGHDRHAALLDALVGYVPSPADRPFAAADTKRSRGDAHAATPPIRTRRLCGRRSPTPSPAASRCSAS